MSKRWILAAVFVAGALTAVDAQEKPLPAQTPAPPASSPGAGRPQTGLRVQILLARCLVAIDVLGPKPSGAQGRIQMS